MALPLATDWRLLHTEMWGGAARRLLADLDAAAGGRLLVRRGLDVGCGPLGWLEVLAERLAADGRLVGLDPDPTILDIARHELDRRGISDVDLVAQNVFVSTLDAHAFDLVHARMEMSLVGWATTQLTELCRLAAPGGWIVVEEPDTATLHPLGPAPATEELLAQLREACLRRASELDSGRHLPELFARIGLEPQLRAEVLALPPGHPYQLLPVHLATQLREPLLEQLAGDELDHLLGDVRRECTQPGTWATTFTLIQAWARVPDEVLLR